MDLIGSGSRCNREALSRVEGKLRNESVFFCKGCRAGKKRAEGGGHYLRYNESRNSRSVYKVEEESKLR